MKAFPVLWPWDGPSLERYTRFGCPREVPFDIVDAVRAWCIKNHSQTPERLAERGGLSASELVAVLEQRRWHPMADRAAVTRLKQLLAMQPRTTPVVR